VILPSHFVLRERLKIREVWAQRGHAGDAVKTPDFKILMLCCLSDASDGANVGEKVGAASHCQRSALQALTALSL
jgi:hypothetical protein